MTSQHLVPVMNLHIQTCEPLTFSSKCRLLNMNGESFLAPDRIHFGATNQYCRKMFTSFVASLLEATYKLFQRNITFMKRKRLGPML